jgi:gliding motility-associated-like protein
LLKIMSVMKNGICLSCKLFLFIFCFTTIPIIIWAQLPTCSSSSTPLIYYLGNSGIYNFDPTLPISATNPSLNTIAPPSGYIGISVNPNLNAASPSPTFYVCDGSDYYYYNGTSWVNTGFTAGAVNPGGGGGYIYSLIGGSGQVYRYDGTANATLITTITSFNSGGPYDLQGDCAGNFYILRMETTAYLEEYNSSGTMINSWTCSGQTSTLSGGGFAMIGSHVYANNTSGLWDGIISGTNVAFTLVTASGLANNPEDFGACPIGGVSQSGNSNDTSFYCGTGAGTIITTSGQGPFTWSVVSGPAVITGSGSSVSVTASSTSVITVLDSNAGGCGTSLDSTLLVVPTATVKAGTPNSLVACGTFNDLLNGSLTNTTSWLTYNISWTPAATILSGGNTMNPAIGPTSTTTYHVIVSTPANEGACVWQDSVLITTIDTSVHTNYTYTIKYGCHGDTVIFNNTTTRAAYYKWVFGDGSIDTAKNPVHIFVNQGIYNVALYGDNPICNDSTIQAINLLHPLHAAFTVDKDSICQGGQINFTNTSITTTQNGINPSYYWSYSDGTTGDITMNATHTFNEPGVYKVMLAVSDFVPCYDTVYHSIEVDSLPFINLAVSDSVFCQGKGITFTGSYLNEGNTGLIWSFGDNDNTAIYDRNPVEHAYELPGTFTIKFSSDYRFCPDTSISKTIQVHAYPTINLGPDTTMCPNAAPITLADINNADNAGATWLWSTGETSPGIVVREPGTYAATITVGGCSATDSITVLKDCYIDIPNVFTPNGDGLNDYFLPRQLLSSGLSSFSMKVFDRWGELLFETTNIDGRGWDGKFNNVVQPQGVYVYIMDVTFKNGVTEHFNGNVTLMH